ncbi:hypothetical protein AC1031_000619 [Aphanomyces cochlioides]|nr:hypothetical protein AC1031_000619 [Aphanomyces cochlioides]
MLEFVLRAVDQQNATQHHRPVQRVIIAINDFFVDGGGRGQTITFPFPAPPESRSNLKQRDELEFQFSKVFEHPTSQDTIFHDVCLDIVQGAINGFNGTIVAYGQTGSGKTYTITGGESYNDRGIIPRAISTLFEAFDERAPTMSYKCFISYLEIYNESIYDLLDQTHLKKSIDEWTKLPLQLSDDLADDAHFRNLGMYEANSEEEALNLLFLGNATRVTSDTPMNMASSRSHAIFTLLLEGRRHGSEVVTHSKLHVVDLAGSERVYKREGTERMRTEGRCINLSLHHLEQVILALQATKSTSMLGKKPLKPRHVPYRNSVLTSVLRGSLGGNCKSVFIGTLNPEAEFIDESISTCRFMQRCSEVVVDVKVNEVVDVQALADRLQKDNERLARQLQETKATLTQQIEMNSHLRLQARSMNISELDESGKIACEDLVERFLVAEPGSTDQAAVLNDIEGLGMAYALHCLRSVKESLIFASNTAAEAQELLAHQNDRLKELETRLVEQKVDAEALKRTISLLTDQVNSPVLPPPTPPVQAERVHPLPPAKNLIESTPNVASASDAIKRRMDLLRQGSIFIKHGRQGNPHPRFVWCSPDLQYLNYRSVGGSPAQSIQIPTSSLQSLVQGQTTKVVE